MLKLVCKDSSADWAALVVSVVAVVEDDAVDPLVREEIRLRTSAANPLLELALEIAPEATELELPRELLLSVLAVVDEVAPIEASASKTAATKPPAGGGGGGDPEAAVLEVLEVA